MVQPLETRDGSNQSNYNNINVLRLILYGAPIKRGEFVGGTFPVLIQTGSFLNPKSPPSAYGPDEIWQKIKNNYPNGLKPTDLTNQVKRQALADNLSAALKSDPNNSESAKEFYHFEFRKVNPFTGRDLYKLYKINPSLHKLYLLVGSHHRINRVKIF